MPEESPLPCFVPVHARIAMAMAKAVGAPTSIAYRAQVASKHMKVQAADMDMAPSTLARKLNPADELAKVLPALKEAA